MANAKLHTSHTYQYQTFVFDGQTVFQNISLQYNASPGHSVAPQINVQHQMDGTSSTPRTGLGNSESLDYYRVISW